MSGVNQDEPKGAFRTGWSANVEDYAIACDWVSQGQLLVVGDAAGGVYAFDGNSGTVRWQHPEIHDGGLLALAVHPDGSKFITSGQDGRVLIWNAEDGQLIHSVEYGNTWVENVAWSLDGTYVAVSVSRRVHVMGVDGEEVWGPMNTRAL